MLGGTPGRLSLDEAGSLSSGGKVTPKASHGKPGSGGHVSYVSGASVPSQTSADALAAEFGSEWTVSTGQLKFSLGPDGEPARLGAGAQGVVYKVGRWAVAWEGWLVGRGAALRPAPRLQSPLAHASAHALALRSPSPPARRCSMAWSRWRSK